MNPERWAQIERLYHAALDRAPGERAAFLKEIGDAELRQEVESLLEQSDGVLHQPLWQALESGVLKAGAQLGPYRIVGPLGAGGMGTVYEARDTRLDRTVAIKVSSVRFSDRFEREARAIASLNHPHICTLHDVGPNYLVMEYVEGHPLKGPLPLVEALRDAVQIADALDAAHAKGIIHRDLKPGNILSTKSGIKLLDFGLAKMAPGETDTTADLSLTETGMIVGTFAYMSPEQASGKEVDRRSDIFSFGCVLYEMITGRRPFGGDNRISILAAILEKEPQPASQLVVALPRELDRILARCLRKDPERRFQHMDDVRVALEELKADCLSGALPAAMDPAPQKSAVPRRFYAAAAVLALAAALGGFALSRLVPGSSGSASPPASRIIRITTELASIVPAVSPDGKMVAYVARSGGKTWDIWVKHVSGGAAIRLAAASPSTYSMAFSADGSGIYYVSNATPRGIYEVPILGGESRLVVAGATAPQPSPDGKWIAFSRENKVFIQPTSGGEARRLGPALEYSWGPRAVWSPDSSRLLAFLCTARCTSFVAVLPVDGGAPQPAPDLFANLLRRGFDKLNILRLVGWLPGGDIVFTASFGDATNLWRIPLSRAGDAAPSAVTIGPWGNEQADIRGNHLVFANIRKTNQIWRLPADVNAGKTRGELERVTPELVEAQFPDVRPDGSALAYVSRKEGGQGVFFLDLRTGKEHNIARRTENLAYSTFDPNGSRIAFGAGGKEWPGFTVSSAGGEIKSLGRLGGRIRGWSRDGRYLLIWRAQGNFNTIGVFDFTTGRVTDILKSDRDLLGARFSPDSRWIAFLSGEAGLPDGFTSAVGNPEASNRLRLWIAPFRGAESIPAAEWIPVAASANLPFWAPDSHSIYYDHPRQDDLTDVPFLRQPLDPSTGRPLGPPSQVFRVAGYSLAGVLLNTISSTRGHVYLLLGSGQSDIWMMDLPK